MHKKYSRILSIALGLVAIVGCRDNTIAGAELSANDIRYIEELGLLKQGETIWLFDSQRGFPG